MRGRVGVVFRARRRHYGGAVAQRIARDGLNTRSSDTAPAAVTEAERREPEVQSGSRFGALASAPYRRFWLGSLASVGATQLLIMGQGKLVFDLSGSEAQLGMAGAATGFAAVIVTLFGGVLADRTNKRYLLMVTSLLVAGLLFALAALDATGAVRVWHVVVIAVLIGLVAGFDYPARQSIFPALIQPGQMMSAVALNSVLWQATRIVVPAIGGFAIAWWGTESVFFAGSAGFLTMFFVLVTLRTPATARPPSRNMLQQFVEGIAFIRSHRVFAVLIPLTYANMFFGIAYMQLMPVFADAYKVTPAGDLSAQAFGWLLGSGGVGAVTGTFLTGRLRARFPVGPLILVASGVSALFILAFAVWQEAAPDPAAHAAPLLSPAFVGSILLIMLISVFSSVFMIASMTVLQMQVPGELRGRVMGLHSIAWSLIAVGGLFVGLLAEAVNARFAVAVSAAILVSVVLLAATTDRTVRRLRVT